MIFIFPTGTPYYLCPEALKGSYCADPATVYSLGAMLFIMICQDLPTRKKVYMLNNDINVGNMSKGKIFIRKCKVPYKHIHSIVYNNLFHLSTECYSLIQACMWDDPMRRIKLAEMLNHEWFKVSNA
ncbi:MAG: protein kinase domain-containing protein [Aeromonas sp.]